MNFFLGVGFVSVVLFNGSAFAQAPTPSHYDVLSAKYAAAGPVTKEEMEGDYLGRCFLQGNDTPVGMIVSTKKITTVNDPDEGPLFPPTSVDTWKMTYYLMEDATSVPLPADANDSQTRLADNQFWNNTDARHGGGVLPLKEINGVVTGLNANGMMNEAKKGSDGYFYGHASLPGQIKDEFCYFFRKLF